jgi:hypothetical protein
MSMPHLHRTWLPPLMLGAGLFILVACGGDDLVRPTTGTLEVTTSTTGSDQDPDGYILTLDDRPEEPIDIRGELAISDLEPGDHFVTLSGVAQTCALIGAGARTVTVIAGDTVNVTFRINCESIAPPAPPGGDPLP